MASGDGIFMASESLERPNLRKGLEIFASRPLSLVAALILGVIVCVASFMLLTPPVIAGYYYAVRNSGREEFFIDLPNITRTTSLVVTGIGRYFIPSYIVGFCGLLPALVLFIAPVLPASILGDDWMYAGIPLMILWLPAFFLMGVTVFNAYPRLIATNDSIDSIRYAFSVGKANPLIPIARGFMLLYPIPGWIIHFLMVFTYPVITAWAVSATGDTTEKWSEVAERSRRLWVGVGSGLALSAVLVSFCFLFVILWETIGFIVWLVFACASVFIWARRFNVKYN